MPWGENGLRHLLYEGCSNDDAGAEVPRKEIDVDVDPHPAYASRHDREERGGGGYNEDHKEGGYAGTQATVVLIAAGVEVADNGGGVDRVEVDAGGVEIGRHGDEEKGEEVRSEGMGK